jgi:hypothetical protein
MGGSNGSRECAPDDKLRDTHQLPFAKMMGFAKGSIYRRAQRPAPVICPSGIFVSSPLCKNISLHPSGKSSLQIRAIPSHKRGVSRSSGNAGWDAVDAAASCVRWDCRAGDEPVSDQQHADERCCCVRRSRVVLTPRRWCQVRGCYVGPTGLRHNVSPRTTVAKEPGHRGEREGNR